MRKSRFTDEQIVAILREADREPVGIVAKRHGVSEQAVYTWRKRFGTFQADDVRRLKQLEAENARLKKLVAERDLEIEVMKEIAAKKNGERAGSPCRSRACDGQGPVATAGLHAARCRAICAALLLDEADEGCAGAGANGGAFGYASGDVRGDGR